ncbi:MFS transporter [Carnimonas nigrificans]|uniref:MFS transporter n=1 Tax=Carnimonas nigrificans TaxID=64323 RepID=UPI0004B7B89D|nr:MFS transporter [Carnimonas nigrificans]
MTEPQRLSMARLLPLTLIGFLAIMTETMPVGMLPQLAAGLDISRALAGQLVAIYALGSLTAIIPIISATHRLNRKHLLLAALVGFLLTNLAASITHNVVLLFVERFLSGVSAGVGWGLLAGFAVRISPAAKAGRALAIMGVGQPLALAIGTPLVSTLVGIVGWQGVFFSTAILALLTLGWCGWMLPSVPGTSRHQHVPMRQVLSDKRILLLLATLLLWVMAHNVLYTYLAPFLEAAGNADYLGSLLMLFGIASFVGIALTTVYIDRFHNVLACAALAVFVVAALVTFLMASHLFIVFGCVALWGLAFGGAPTLLIKYLSDMAGSQIDFAQAAFATVFNGAIFAGSLVGGAALNLAGAGVEPLLQALLALLAALAWWRMLHQHKAWQEQ